MSRTAYAPYKWLGFAVAVLIAGLGGILGLVEDVATQLVIFFTAATFALVLWVWNYGTTRWTERSPLVGAAGTEPAPAEAEADGERRSEGQVIRNFLVRNKITIIVLLILIGIYAILAVTVEGFFTLANVIATLVLAGLVVLAILLNKFIAQNKGAFIGLSVLVGLFVLASLLVEGFFSVANIKSMLVFAAFLGLACVGQTVVALLGGLDLSIPFVIGSANVGLLYLMSLGVPSWIATIIILLLGGIIGFIGGILSFRIQGQALILTLGVGFAVSGGTQILTSIGTRYSGNVFGEVPHWLTNLAAMNGRTFGLDIPPVIFIWLGMAILLIVGMRHTVYGRHLYALGGNRRSAQRLSISERRYWVGAYMVSGLVSAMTGALLLGWSGGGFIGVGQPYLFMTLAAVVIGGTSLLGGAGGYGFTVIGVLVLQVLISFLVGIGLSFEGQQFVLGLLILPMVALYARSPHIRTQI